MTTGSARDVSERIEILLDELGQNAMPAVTERVEELLHCVMELYGGGLERVLEIGGPELTRRLADDELVGNLLVLHDLHPDDVTTRVQAALDRVRPYLGSHAGGVSFSGVDEHGVVHLGLEGSCDGCPSSAETVRNAIEDAILAAAPDVVAVEATGVVEREPTLLQIEPFRPHGAGAWTRLDLEVPPRSMQVHDVAGAEVLVANLDGTLVAYLDRCADCAAPLSRGTLSGDQVGCAACGAGYDLRLAGRAVAEDRASLVPLPLLPDQGAWKVAVPAGAVAS